MRTGRKPLMRNLDCRTKRGKERIAAESEARNILAKKFDIEIAKPKDDSSEDDGFIYKNGKLIGVCEIKTRVFYNSRIKSPFTLNRFKEDKDGYLISYNKIEQLKKQTLLNQIHSYIFVNIPHDKVIVKIHLLNEKGEFHVSHSIDHRKTRKTINNKDFKLCKVALIPYEGNKDHIEIIKYG